MRIQIVQLERETYVKLLFAAVLASIFAYVYMVNVVSFNTASRERLTRMISVRQSEVNELESQLLAKHKTVDRSIAHQFGLVQSVENQAIVVVRDSSTRLTLNE